MASELYHRHSGTGDTLYAVITSAARTVWNGSAFVSFVVANWATYDVAMAESPASSYRYIATMPAGITASGDYKIEVYEQAGGSPAITDTLLATYVLHWTGAAMFDLQSWEVDSTGDETLGVAKALEVILAMLGGVASYNESTGVWTIKGRDDTTTIMQITITDEGTRTVSTIA